MRCEAVRCEEIEMKSEVLRIEAVLPPDGWARLRQWWQRLARLSRRTPRQLRLAENLALGDRRFVAVIEYRRERFLVGGTSAALVLLARLDGAADGIPDPASPKPMAESVLEQP